MVCMEGDTIVALNIELQSSVYTGVHIMDLLAMLGFQGFHGPWGHLSTSCPCTASNHGAGGIC
jgi:hypothetical protein